MQVILQIKKNNLDLIKSGKKKNEWRELSAFNKKTLMVRREDGMLDGNKDIKSIKFVNGYRKDREVMEIEVVSIGAVKFARDVDIPEDNFKALAGQMAIRIELGKILQ